MARYVALLRGINVGGKRKVPMADLRTAFEALGYDDVATYIQSGNVVFRTGDARAGLEAAIEAALDERFGFPVPVVVRSAAQLRGVVEQAPAGFGTQPDTYLSDVVFLKAPLTPKAAFEVLERREGVDEAWAGRGVVYFQRLAAQRTKSRLSRIVSLPEYQLMTIRSWSTTTKLLELVD